MTAPTTSQTRLNPFPWYQRMREAQPVAYDPRSGAWNVFRYDDVQRVLSEHTTFSSQFRGGGEPSASQPLAASMISTDPPRHRQLRTLVTQAFTPRAIEALAPRIATIVDELLAQAVPAGRMDVIHDFGIPLPVIVIAELLASRRPTATASSAGPTRSSRWPRRARPRRPRRSARWPSTSWP